MPRVAIEAKGIGLDLFKFLFRIFIILAVPAALALLTFLYMKEHLFDPMEVGNTKTVLVDIPANSSVGDIGDILKEKQIVKAGWVVSILATIRSRGGQIQSGEYELNKAMSPKDVLDKLVSGDSFKRKVETEPGQKIEEVAEALQHAGIIAEKDFTEACRKQDLLVRAGISAQSFEGYLFPNKYEFSKGTPVARIIWKMLEEGENVWKPEYTAKAEELQLSRHEVLTLASLLLAETTIESEMAIISGVFHNRMENLMKLKSKPALLYGLGDFEGEWTEDQYLDAENLYNTFAQYGLPPGPINNPGIKAIEAALFPKEHQFLFFANDGAGGHLYAENLREFNDIQLKLGR